LEIIHQVIDFITHLHEHLNGIIDYFHGWAYLIFFIIIFCETGLVFAPFLPGDSLLFAAGTFAATGTLSIYWLFPLFAVAAIGGDSLNYWIGSLIGPRAFTDKIPLLKRDYLERTYRFYEKHGGRTVILGRFIPMMRSFAPFIGGIARMPYKRFLAYNISGALIWTTLFTFGGYFFGSIQIVRRHFSLIILGIVIISFCPWLFMYIKERLFARRIKSDQSA
jgi:membrane-associated protein